MPSYAVYMQYIDYKLKSRLSRFLPHRFWPVFFQWSLEVAAAMTAVSRERERISGNNKTKVGESWINK